MKRTAFINRKATALVLAALMLAACLVLPGCLKKDPGETQAAPDTADAVSAIADTQTSATAAADDTTSDVADQTTAEPTAPVAAEQTGYINFNKDHVNIRADHNTDAEIVGRVESFERITVNEVYTDQTAKTELQRWGKTTFNGVTGWVALYYLTPLEIADTVNDDAALNALWTRLEGYWNTADQKEGASFLFDGGKPQFTFAVWYSEYTFYMEPNAPFTGDVNGIVKLDTTVYLVDYFEEPEIEEGFLYLDLSEIDTGKIRVNYGNQGGWVECFFAGKTSQEAMPPI